MSRNGSGVYSLPTNSWNPATVGVSATPADWQALINDVAAALTQSLSADGQTPLSGNLNMAGNKLTGLSAGTATGDSVRWQQLFSLGQPLDIASASTTDIGAQNTTILNITGTTTITSFGANYNGPRFLRFADVLILTHGSALVLPTAANITTAAGDSAVVVPNGTPANGWRVVAYQRASGAAFDGSVTTNSILNDAVTFAKIQNVTTATILGRSTAGTGDVEALTGAQATALLSVASETVSGRVELADATEAAAGTDGTRALSPLRLRDALAASGSAPLYACRAWVNFNGTGTVAIRAAGNVSSITDNGVGDYTVNFTTAMPDANYCALPVSGRASGDFLGNVVNVTDFPTTTFCRLLIRLGQNPGTTTDQASVNVAIFR